MKKSVLFILAVIVLFHIVWYAGSCAYQRQGIPDQKEAKEYQEKYLKRMNIAIDQSKMEETDINANGYRLRLTVFPAGKHAPTLVFMPGTMCYAQLYIEFLYKMYRQGFNVVGIDMRGHGMSSGLRGNYDINGLVDDLLAGVKYARDRFGGRVAIAGSSQGGMVAFYAAARDDSIDAAVCHNLADLNGKDNLVLVRFWMPRALVPVAGFLTGLYRNYSIPVSLYLDLDREHLKDGSTLSADVKENPLMVSWISIGALGSMMRTELPKPVEKIRVPIMMVYSDGDNIFPQAYVESIYNRLTCEKSSLLLKNTDHMIMTNHLDRVIGPVSAWLKKTMR
ncbi:MAG: alpha/beta fold hydrolase [Spirochaetes bacterium]|nr:alpha/beta fold hydrolase [Spirochaetota bacterium]